MDDLVAFLRARLDEDEARAKPLIAEDDVYRWSDVHSDVEWFLAAGGPQAHEFALAAQVLREVAAKRAILDHHKPIRHEGRTMCHSCLGAVLSWPCPTLQHLATVYSDHPDYRPEWKP